MSKKPKIIADNKIPFLKGVLEPYAEVEYYDGFKITKQCIRDADALIIRTRTKCNAELLDNSNIKLIATATIGYDHIDTEYCNNHNIHWLNAPGCNSSSVMQYITSALLTIASKNNFALFERTLGVIGIGNVGAKVVKIAEAFGMKVLQNDPPRMRKENCTQFVPLDELIYNSDIITFHVPLNKVGIDKTLYLADESFFEKVNKGTILLNSSRGRVVNTSALKKTIKSGKVSYAVLDVWENEPDIDKELLEMVSIATPHIAGYSADGKANGTSICVNAVSNYFNLGIEENWYPQNIPSPDSSSVIKINSGNLAYQEILYRAVCSTYNILDDNNRLKNSPETFEKQRGDYPVRREFPFYKVELNSAESKIVNTLRNLGFRIN